MLPCLGTYFPLLISLISYDKSFQLHFRRVVISTFLFHRESPIAPKEENGAVNRPAAYLATRGHIT